MSAFKEGKFSSFIGSRKIKYICFAIWLSALVFDLSVSWLTRGYIHQPTSGIVTGVLTLPAAFIAVYINIMIGVANLKGPTPLYKVWWLIAAAGFFQWFVIVPKVLRAAAKRRSNIYGFLLIAVSVLAVQQSIKLFLEFREYRYEHFSVSCADGNALNFTVEFKKDFPMFLNVQYQEFSSGFFSLREERNYSHFFPIYWAVAPVRSLTDKSVEEQATELKEDKRGLIKADYLYLRMEPPVWRKFPTGTQFNEVADCYLKNRDKINQFISVNTAGKKLGIAAISYEDFYYPNSDRDRSSSLDFDSFRYYFRCKGEHRSVRLEHPSIGNFSYYSDNRYDFGRVVDGGRALQIFNQKIWSEIKAGQCRNKEGALFTDLFRASP